MRIPKSIWLVCLLAAAPLAAGETLQVLPPLATSGDALPAVSTDVDGPAISRDGVVQPASIAIAGPETLPQPAPDPALTIQALEELALAGNPTLAQAAARIEALRGRWVQVGLPPNPTAGYLGSEIGNDGRGGQQGGFAGQDYITGNKLQLNRAVVAQEIQQAEQRLIATALRVRTDVRKAGYAALIAQRRVQLANDLVRLSGQAVAASQELLKAEEIPLAGLLQTEVEQQNAQLLLQTAGNDLNAAWQQLSAVIGQDLPVQTLAGDVSQLPAALMWDEVLIRITASSPELGAAMTEIVQAQAALRRAYAEPVPDVSTQLSVQYDDSTNDTIVGAQVGIPLPLWNRNQGGIRQARAEIAEAQRNAVRVEMDLKQRLARVYQTYASARARAETYASSILPKAQQTIELAQQGYGSGEVGYLDLITAQRTYSQTNLAYIESLENLWSSWAEIDGMLLTGSLIAPVE